jgi:hypothetical protein
LDIGSLPFSEMMRSLNVSHATLVPVLLVAGGPAAVARFSAAIASAKPEHTMIFYCDGFDGNKTTEPLINDINHFGHCSLLRGCCVK